MCMHACMQHASELDADARSGGVQPMRCEPAHVHACSSEAWADACRTAAHAGAASLSTSHGRWRWTSRGPPRAKGHGDGLVVATSLTSTTSSAHASEKRSPMRLWCLRGFHGRSSARAAAAPHASWYTSAVAATARASCRTGKEPCSLEGADGCSWPLVLGPSLLSPWGDDACRQNTADADRRWPGWCRRAGRPAEWA